MQGRSLVNVTASSLIILAWVLIFPAGAAADLAQVLQRGVLRHLGVPYAHFVTGSGDGLDVELMERFAAHLGVRYQYVRSSWDNILTDLTGKRLVVQPDGSELLDQVAVRGDVASSGITILPARRKRVNFSTPTFPTQVWLLARSDSPIAPIVPSGAIAGDVRQVKSLLPNRLLLGKRHTCLDPFLYGLDRIGVRIKWFQGHLNELAPAVINGEAEVTLLDVPDALIALNKWPGKIKVIGPVSPPQVMGSAFAKDSPALREAFNRYFRKCVADGSYEHLVSKYYPTIFHYFGDFFKNL